MFKEEKKIRTIRMRRSTWPPASSAGQQKSFVPFLRIDACMGMRQTLLELNSQLYRCFRLNVTELMHLLTSGVALVAMVSIKFIAHQRGNCVSPMHAGFAWWSDCRSALFIILISTCTVHAHNYCKVCRLYNVIYNLYIHL